MGLFGINDVQVLDTYEDLSVEGGIRFNEFVVVTDNTNQMSLGDLLKSLDVLDEENGIGSSLYVVCCR